MVVARIHDGDRHAELSQQVQPFINDRVRYGVGNDVFVVYRQAVDNKDFMSPPQPKG